MSLKWFKAYNLDGTTTDSGVYLIAYAKGDKAIVVYVGQSENIKQRINKHVSNSEENENLREFIKNPPGKIYVYYTIAHQSDNLNNIEHTAFIRYGQSKYLYNEVTPPGRFLEHLNFP
jgi:excinuclease UvrABC nuclease subunit